MGVHTLIDFDLPVVLPWRPANEVPGDSLISDLVVRHRGVVDHIPRQIKGHEEAGLGAVRGCAVDQVRPEGYHDLVDRVLFHS